MKRTHQTLLAPLATLLAAVAFAASAHAAALKTVTIDVAGKKFGDNLETSADSATVDTLLASPRYDYQITAKVTGSGSLAAIVPAASDFGTFLDKIKPGSSSLLKGTVLNPTGKLPLKVVFNKTVSGDIVVPVVGTVDASLVLTATIDAMGKASFKVTRVSLKINGAPATGDITFDPTSNVKVGNELLGTEGTYAGLTAATTAVATSGIISIKLEKTGSFSGAATVGGKKLPFKGAFGANNSSGEIILTKPAVAKLTLNILPATNVIDAAITGVPQVTFSAKKAAYGKAVAFTKPGTYNVLHRAGALPQGKTAADIPQGTGFSTVKIAADGSVKFTTTLADGSPKATATGVVTAGDQIAFYAPLYKTQGVLIGLLKVNTAVATPSLAVDPSSVLRWLKSPITGDKLFPGGFDTTPVVIGELYAKPAVGVAVLPSPLGFQGAFGNLGAVPIPVQQVTLDTKSKVTATGANANKVTVTLTTATGLFKGSFSAGTPAKIYKFNGLILPKSFGGAGGFFLGQPAVTTPATRIESGSVTLQ